MVAGLVTCGCIPEPGHTAILEISLVLSCWSVRPCGYAICTSFIQTLYLMRQVATDNETILGPQKCEL